VSSSPAGITCGADCYEPYPAETVVTLTATPTLLFTGWTGCDSVSGATCTVTMRSARSVSAGFLRLLLF
jgi:List-Bact-rpt repeat protein